MKIKVIAFALLVASCTQNSKIDEITEKASINITIPKFDNHQTVNYSDVYSAVDIIVLEDNPEVNLGNIYSLETTKDGDYLLFDLISHCIVLYDSIGHFKNLIGEVGHSQKEYIFPTSVAYDPFQDNIVVWDNFYLKIYNLNGEFNSALKLPWSSGEVKVLDSETYVIYKNPYLIENDETGSCIKVIRKTDGQLVKEYWPFSSDDTSVQPSVNAVFTMQAGTMYCFPPYSSRLFSIGQKGISPIVSILFENSPGNWIYGENCAEIKYRREHVMHTEGFDNRVSKLYETPDYYVSNVSYNGAIYLWIFDKNTQKTICFADGVCNDMAGYLGTSYIQTVINRKVYCLIDPVSYMHFLKENSLNISSEQNLGLIQAMSKTREPIIQVCTLK